jgi:hypothetical protein
LFGKTPQQQSDEDGGQYAECANKETSFHIESPPFCFFETQGDNQSALYKVTTLP